MSSRNDDIAPPSTEGQALAVEETDLSERCQELQQGIEQDEEGMRVALHELTGAARSKLDVRKHIKTFPLTWAIGGFLVGMWLGSRRPLARVGDERRS